MAATSKERFRGLETERLIIRNFSLYDDESFFAYKRLPECVRFQFWRPQTLEEVQRFLRDMESVTPGTPGAWLQLAICLKETGELIGDIGLHFLPDSAQQAEIGYTVSPAHQGRGYAKEAVRAALSYLFGMPGMHRVTASVDPHNAPSAAVLEKLGYRREAQFQKSVYMDGQWQDDWVYAVLEEEWNG